MASYRVYKVDEKWDAEVYIYWDCSYVLSDGKLLRTLQSESWCRCCNGLVAGEVVPSIEEIENDIRKWSDPNDKVCKCFSRSTIEQTLANAHLRMKWRPTRKSPPRCLKCQSTDIVNVNIDNENDNDRFVDPVSGTSIRLLSWGHASMAYEERRRLTPEGLLIEVDKNGFSDLFDSIDET